mmetsp:Transcript_36074/g.81193  ORF Transcript_36074/g.81193 Transcript_36074/m.81193 type:complete len:239 (-) Transcript_36074:5142-5858(-)
MVAHRLLQEFSRGALVPRVGLLPAGGRELLVQSCSWTLPPPPRKFGWPGDGRLSCGADAVRRECGSRRFLSSRRGGKGLQQVYPRDARNFILADSFTPLVTLYSFNDQKLVSCFSILQTFTSDRLAIPSHSPSISSWRGRGRPVVFLVVTCIGRKRRFRARDRAERRCERLRVLRLASFPLLVDVSSSDGLVRKHLHMLGHRHFAVAYTERWSPSHRARRTHGQRDLLLPHRQLCLRR